MMMNFKQQQQQAKANKKNFKPRRRNSDKFPLRFTALNFFMLQHPKGRQAIRGADKSMTLKINTIAIRHAPNVS